MEIGKKLRELRLRKDLTQEDLADRCDLTKGYISQLENDLTSPSIATLTDILTLLGSSLKEFFDDEDEQLVFGKDDYFVKDYSDETVTWLVPTAQKNQMEPILVTLCPGASTDDDNPHDGEEFGYVLKGVIRLKVGKNEYTVKEGESFYFTAAENHSLKNIGEGGAEIVWVTCPPNF